MLVPLKRERFEQLIPLIATGLQYKYYWGKFPDFLQRLLFSVVSVVVVLLLRGLVGEGLGPVLFAIGLVAALYWLWGPVFWASRRNIECRRYKYSGFWRGRVLDVYVTDELIGKEETVNNKGDLVIVENRERRINLEVGDETGFTAQLQAPLRVTHKVITRGQIAEMVVMSTRADLSKIDKISDIYIPKHDLWVNDYPYLRRDFFIDTSRRLREQQQERPRRRKYEQEELEPRPRRYEEEESPRRPQRRRARREEF
ncbi:MAG: phosphate ABC transporter permease [Nostocaceae cyanobacterium]|nr:phosphate ABC transporter permease [Nostocaceae cyanobacterium]